MEKEKQIEEMARTLCGEKESTCHECDSFALCEFWIEASTLYNAHYRKQREGEWRTVDETNLSKITECTACKKSFWFMKKGQLNIDRMPFCPECGATMKGGAHNA